jgi:CheY-like chemotaxis protein
VARILLIDDDPILRSAMAATLITRHEVRTAKHGFDGLLQMKYETPEVVISDLEMPLMSGFELLSVIRRRFPLVCVIAASGEFSTPEGELPMGVIADAFYAKGKQNPEALLLLVDQVFEHRANYVRTHRKESAPVWIPRNGIDSSGHAFVVITCTECLRSFPLSLESEEPTREIQETPCLFCGNLVRYIIDFTLPLSGRRRSA